MILWFYKIRQKNKPTVAALSMSVWFIAFILLASGGCSYYNNPDAPEQVVLLHGFGRKGSAMYLLQKRIRDAGFKAHSIEYASLQEPPDVILEMDWFRFEAQK